MKFIIMVTDSAHEYKSDNKGHALWLARILAITLNKTIQVVEMCEELGNTFPVMVAEAVPKNGNAWLYDSCGQLIG